jgi:hypothetical protein
MSDQQLFGLMAAAEEQQRLIDDLIAQLNKQRLALEAAVEKQVGYIPALGMRVGDAAAKAVDESLGKAPKAAAAAYTQAADALNNAAKDVREASGWIGWKLAGLLLGIGATAFGALYLAALVMLPSLGELQARRADAERLQVRVEELEKRGGRIEYSTCGKAKRLCIKVDKSTTYQDNYMIPAGY